MTDPVSSPAQSGTHRPRPAPVPHTAVPSHSAGASGAGQHRRPPSTHRPTARDSIGKLHHLSALAINIAFHCHKKSEPNTPRPHSGVNSFKHALSIARAEKPGNLPTLSISLPHNRGILFEECSTAGSEEQRTRFSLAQRQQCQTTLGHATKYDRNALAHQGRRTTKHDTNFPKRPRRQSGVPTHVCTWEPL